MRGRSSLLAPALLLCLSISARADTVVVVDSPGYVATGPGYYEPSRWALGLSLGEPTGISAKKYLGGRNAFDVNLDFVYGPGFRFGADYLWGLGQLLTDRSVMNLNVYLGAGPFIGTLRGPCGGFYNWQDTCSGDVYLGGRMPIGIEAVFRNAPVTLGLEVAPGLAFAPGRVGLLVDASLMLRVLL